MAGGNNHNGAEALIPGLVRVGRRLEPLVLPQNGGIERVNVAVTYHCNSKCVMCNIWKIDYSDGVLRSREVTLEEYRRVFSDRTHFGGLKEVGITGGEPFLRRDLDQVVRLFLELFPGLSLGISSNSFKSDLAVAVVGRMLEGHDLKAHGQRFGVSLSIDGVGEVHDRIRGVPGAYGKVLETLRGLKENFPDIGLNISFTLIESNWEQVWPLFEVSRELGVGFSFRFAQTSGSYYQNDEMQFAWPDEILDQVQAQIDRIRAEGGALDGYFYGHMVDYQRDPRELNRCYSGRNSFYLDPFGEVYPCILLTKPYGNIKQRPFGEIWKGPEARATRNWIWEQHCHCWTQCEFETTRRRSWPALFESVQEKARRLVG